MTADLGAAAGPCPRTRCEGTLTVEAAGVADDLTPVAYAVCGSCGRVVEQAVQVEGQEALW